MFNNEGSDQLKVIHSDIRGPVYERSLELRAQGIEVLRLNTGNPATFGFRMPASVKNALLDHIDDATADCGARGMESARGARAACERPVGITNVEDDGIFVGNGVSELATILCSSILSPGDELLMPMPSYSLWSNGAYLAGGRPVFYVCDEENDWSPDFEDIERKITPRTRALVIINPNNPTGQVYPPEVVKAMVDIARRHRLLVISDEIYDRLIMDGMPYRSAATFAPDLPVVTLNGLSKSHVVCGIRVGWAVITGPRAETETLKRNFSKLCSLRLCANTCANLVIKAALDDPESTRAMLVPGGRLYDQVKAGCRALDELQSRGLITYKRPHAAFYVFPRLADRLGIKNDAQFAFDLLEKKHILLVGGSGFDWPEPNHFRLVLLPEPDVIYNAILEIGDFLEGYRQ